MINIKTKPSKSIKTQQQQDLQVIQNRIHDERKQYRLVGRVELQKQIIKLELESNASSNIDEQVELQFKATQLKEQLAYWDNCYQIGKYPEAFR